MIKEQNQGLAAELGGFMFKPRLNKTSLDLSATMKSLELRMPEMLAERKKFLESKRKEAAEVNMTHYKCLYSFPSRFTLCLYRRKWQNVPFLLVVVDYVVQRNY
jgi:hypothetical protein